MIDAIVVPQGAEYKAVYRAISQDKNSSLPVISIPMGFNQVEAEATLAQIEALNIKKLVLMGLCGSLSPKYSVGDIVIYQSCFDPHQQITLETDRKLTTTIYNQLPRASIVKSFTSDRVISLTQEKQQFYRTYKTDVVDMEGFSYLQLLQASNIAVAILRVVSDDPKHNIPDLTQAIGDRGKLKILPLIFAFLKQPLAAIGLIKGSLKGLKNLKFVVHNIII